jgi:hypothetical protein
MVTTKAASEFGWGAVAIWTAVTTLVWGVGLLPVMAMISGVFFTGTDYQPNLAGRILFIGGCCGGFCFLSAVVLGSGQWWVLNKTSSSLAEGWFATTAVGGGFAWTLGWLANFGVFVLGNFTSNEGSDWTIGGLAGGAILGLILGTSQARILSRQVPHAVRWVPVSILGWMAGLIIYWLVYQSSGGPFETVVTSYYEGSMWPKAVAAPGAGPAMLAGWIAGGLVVGIITGLAMKRLLVGTVQPQQEILTPNPQPPTPAS